MKRLFNCTAIASCILLSGCQQLVKVQENQVNQAIRSKSDHVLTTDHLSTETQSIIKMLGFSEKQCLQKFENCTELLQHNSLSSADERYAALSELYLASALELIEKKQTQQALNALDQSLRYSYVYLFHGRVSPNIRVFDQRQMSVRSFYNVALSRLISISYDNMQTGQLLPQQFNVADQRYDLDLSHYPELKQQKIELIKSSYHLNFSGFDQINRQDGIGAEFLLVTQDHTKPNNSFILDPMSTYQDTVNPNIHTARYLSATALLQPKSGYDQVEDILSKPSVWQLKLFNPYKYKNAEIKGHQYALTANYSVPYAYWLAEQKLQSAGMLSLLDRTEYLRMPHVYMLEPYQPNKKIIVLIHGLASSPETWLNLTNNILADQVLRDQYQVWQVAYSTNMPIFESRFQINALLKQTFAQVQPNTASAEQAVVIGHSMGGIISRLLVSQADVSDKAIPLLNYQQYVRLQQYPVIAERFQFKSELPFSRAIFVAAPHRGSELTDQWYVRIAKKLVKLPTSFFDQVDLQLNGTQSTVGMVQSGPDDLSPSSRFMQLTYDIVPPKNFPYHSIIGNASSSQDLQKISDGIVPYRSSHLSGAVSEEIITGGHSIHLESETLLELRRILHEHLK